MNRAAVITKGLAALILLAALAAGIPWALWHFIGWPLPHRLPGWHQLSADLTQHGIADTTRLKALACVVWLAWAVLVASLAVEIPATIRGRAARIAVGGPLQPMVAQLLAAVAIAALSMTPRPTASGPQPLAAALGAGRSARPVPAMALAVEATPATITPLATITTPALIDSGGPSSPQPPGAAAQPLRSYVVARNDTLWGIAERELGDPLRWRDIYALNQDRPQPGGTRLVDPHWIDPGWTLLLPDAPATAAVPPPAMPAPTPQPPTTTPPAPEPATVEPPAASRVSPSAPAPPGPTEAAGIHDSPAIPPAAAATPATVSLPSGSIVGGTFAAGVLATIAIGRLRRRHGYRPCPPEPGRALTPPPLGATIRRLAAGLASPDGDDPPPIADPTSTLDKRNQRSDVIEIGEHDAATVSLDLADLSGVALCGDAAGEVARAWATSLLSGAGPLAAEVVATATTMERLFPGVEDVAGLRSTEDTAQLTRLLEAEIVTRTRKLVATGAGDAAAYRQANPAEPLPALLVYLDALAPTDAPRLVPTVKSCARLGIAVVFLADVEAAPIRLRLQGRLVRATEPADQTGKFVGTRLFGLQAEEAVDVLRALASAEFRPTSEDNPEWTEVIERMEQPPPEPQPWPDQPAAGAGSLTAPVRVRALGPLTITVSGRVIARGLRSVAKELLVYYLLRPEGATVEEAVDHLWPDTDPKLVHRQFWTAASNLRTMLRDGAEAESKILDLAGDVYRLDPAVVCADLWDFEAALADAARAGDDTVGTEALRRAVDAYGGDLAQGAGWIWIEASREDLHRRAVDAHLGLAELEQGVGHPAGAEAVLARVIEIDRYAEEPYRRLMALQAARGDTDAVKATWRQLQRRLVEIDLDPDPATARLYRRLVSGDLDQRAGGQ
ncbi:MAG TPA: BTAD domain-containing putative transcriptional regulator [Acidimicrobiales bacterium]|nr:BTAD domain-containing putative transcriptional regulator [Acidimicrobiales bacterium]